MHCDECDEFEDYEWDFYNIWGDHVEGAVMICRMHGLLAPGWVYDEAAEQKGWRENTATYPAPVVTKEEEAHDRLDR